MVMSAIRQHHGKSPDGFRKIEHSAWEESSKDEIYIGSKIFMRDSSGRIWYGGVPVYWEKKKRMTRGYTQKVFPQGRQEMTKQGLMELAPWLVPPWRSVRIEK